MNANTKQRYISTAIWDDDWFDSLSVLEKLVYFYLLTNTHTNAAGVYQCTLKNMRLEIGLNREQVEEIMGKFAATGKAYYYKDYIIIPKWLRHQKVGERSKMYLGAAQVLKSLPEDVKAFLRVRKHYDYDVSEIIGKGDIANEYPIDSLCQNKDSLSNKTDNLLENEDKTGIADRKNDLLTAHDSDSDLDSDLDPDLDIDTRSDTLSAYFIKQWQGNADVFNCLARLKHPAEWQAFWEKNSYTKEQIDTAIKNFIEGVKTGDIQRRYIPSSPDGFVINGWLSRCQTSFKKQAPGHRIANDNLSEDDVSKYFTEA